MTPTTEQTPRLFSRSADGDRVYPMYRYSKAADGDHVYPMYRYSKVQFYSNCPKTGPQKKTLAALAAPAAAPRRREERLFFSSP